MKTIGVIPARWGSKRFEGKVLAKILGKPMIQHVWERARQSSLLEEVIIACDDQRIQAQAERFSAQVVMTSKDHPSGTERIIEAVKDIECEIVVNIQGDEPLIHPKTIDALVRALLVDKSCLMATAIFPLKDKKLVQDPNVVKVVIDRLGYALYFSRAVVPFPRDSDLAGQKYYKHIGLYAYRKSFLMTYQNLPASSLESTEKLEQLRVLEAGFRIKTIETAHDSCGVDTPEDLKSIEKQLS